MASDVLIPLGFFTAVVLISYFVLESRRRREAQRVEFHGRLLDRITSVQELTQLLGHEAGERLLASLSPQAAQPHHRILAAVRFGIVTLVLGATLFVAISAGSFPTEGEDLRILATLAVGLGAGLLLAAAASYGLARHMGLLNGHEKRTPKVNASL